MAASQFTTARFRSPAPPERRLPGLVGGGVQIAGPGQAPNTVNLPWQLYPPAGATSFNLAANQAIVGAGATFLPAGASFQLPANCYGVISSIELTLNGIVLASNVTWAILVQNAAVNGFNRLTVLGRTGASSVSKSWDGPLGIEIPLGGSIGVLITDVDGGAYTAGTNLYGWFLPQQQ